jgi:hypothetical protein
MTQHAAVPLDDVVPAPPDLPARGTDAITTEVAR